MNIQDIKKLVDMFDNSTSVKLKLSYDNFEISLEKSLSKNDKSNQVLASEYAPQMQIQQIPDAMESASQAKKANNTEIIRSPMVGTFYRAPSPDSAPYVNIGDKVKKGQTIAIIEAMKIMNEIEVEFDCKIIDIIPADAQSVEFSSELFVVEKI